MKTLLFASVLTLLGLPAFADSETAAASGVPTAQPQQTQPVGYLYGKSTNPPMGVYVTEQRQGTWLYPPNPSGR